MTIITTFLMCSFLFTVFFLYISFQRHLILPAVQVFTLLIAIAIAMRLNVLERQITNVQGTVQGHSEGVVE